MSMEANDTFINLIKTHILFGKTILELGSGSGTTNKLSKRYNMISIEESIEYWGKYDSYYIHAPIVNGWYDRNVIAPVLKELKYDAIIVDGPAHGERIGFFKNLDLFDTSVAIFFDDLDRPEDKTAALNISEQIQRPLKLETDKIGYIRPA